MTVAALLTLRGLMALLLLGTLYAQLWSIPQAAIAGAHYFPELASHAVPYAVVLIAIVGCAQLIIVAMWALVGRVRRGDLFTARSLGWITTVIWAGGIATVLAIGLEVHVLAVVGVSPPAVGVLLTLCIIAGGALTFLLLALRDRLRRGAALPSELTPVI